MKKAKEVVVITTTVVTAISLHAIAINNKNIEIENIKEEKRIMEMQNQDALEEKHIEVEELKKSFKDLENSYDELNKKNNVLEKENSKLKKELSKVKNFELTYYTSLPVENGGYTTTAVQTKLRHGVVASNHYPIGTKILIEGVVYTVEDTGGSEFDSPNRLDVLVERRAGEDDDAYLRRVNNMGRKHVKGKIL